MAYIQLGDVCNVVKGEIGITKAIPGEYPMVTTGEERKSHNSFQLDTKAVLVPLVSATGHGHASINNNANILIKFLLQLAYVTLSYLRIIEPFNHFFNFNL